MKSLKHNHTLTIRREETGLFRVLLSAILLALVGIAALTIASAASLSSLESAAGSPVDPATAFPEDTLFYVEFTKPVQTLDTLESMHFWPDALALMAELARLTGLGAEPLENLINDHSARGSMSRFKTHLELLGCRRIAAGWVLVPGTSKPEPVFVMQSDKPGDPLPSLTWMSRRFTLGLSMLCEKDLQTNAFRIEDHGGRTCIKGKETSEGLVFSLPAGVKAMNAVASALSAKDGPDSSFLADSEGFQDAVAGLPDAFSVRAYLNTPMLAARIQKCPALSQGAKRLIRTALAGTGPIGIARKIEKDSIRVWISGRLFKDQFETAYPGVLDSLVSVEKPLSNLFPENALCTYEVGLHPRTMLQILGTLIDAGAPCFYHELQDFLGRFEEATGLDPDVDFLPFLVPHLAAAWLPPEEAPDGWPFPRTVLVMRIKDREALDRFLSGLLEWETGALAPWTSGLISAHFMTEFFAGMELKGLKLDSPISLPLPSPCFALTENFLIFSPLRSAVKETVEIVQGMRPGLSRETLFDQEGIQPGAKELVHLNSKAWEKDWEEWWGICVSLSSLFFLDKGALAACPMDQERVHRLGEALFRLMGKLDRAIGSTVVDAEGRFLFFMEMPVRESP
ncbi:MAG: hypothetical protein ACYTG7_19800 [Planctomycetota bacterium]|jgi:hypothetical protein